MATKNWIYPVNDKRSLLNIISFCYFTVFLGHSVWRSTFYHYSLEVIKLDQTEISWLFSIASIPGLFTFFLGYIAHKVPLYILTGSTLFLLGSGLIILGFAVDSRGLLLGTFTLSIGFSWFLPLAHNVCIRKGIPQSVNRSLGRLKSLGPLAAALTAFLIYFFNHNKQIEILFIICGCILLLASVIVGASLQGFQYRRKLATLHLLPNLWSFYLLNFIAGSRSALFKTFIITQFVAAFHLSLVEMSILLLAGNVSGFFGYRLIGVLADKYNPVNILTVLYIIVAGIFSAFSYVQAGSEFGLKLAVVLFLIDSLLFGSAVVTDAYLKKVDLGDYIVSDLATGMTFFHLAGLLLPIAGNIIWVNFGINAVLSLATIISIAGAVVSRFMVVLIKN